MTVRRRPPVSRRAFLKTTLAAAGAVVVGVRCDSGSDPTPAGDANGDTPSDTPAGDSDPGPGADPLAGTPEWATHFPQSVASGSPAQTSVVLWTRAVDAARPLEDLALTLEVAPDPTLASPLALDTLTLTAPTDHDGCLKVLLTGLTAGTTYWYRFTYTDLDGAQHATRVGRTATLPDASVDTPARFAVVSCQDYIGKRYSTLRRLVDAADGIGADGTGSPGLHAVVHLGDYIYETTGDPSFQGEDGGGADSRRIVFDDQAGVQTLGEGASAYQAAVSLDNYRQLYRVYRTDPDLQRLHERFPIVAVWDDHEFSDDCWGTTATYLDGRADEDQPERHDDAVRAWFEFMPVAAGAVVPDGGESSGAVGTPGGDALRTPAIWRDLRVGKHAHLFVTDLRTNRVDHLIPEDALPGRVVLDQATLEARYGDVPSAAQPYVDVATFAGGTYAALLALADWPEEERTGLVSAAYLNDLIAAATEASEAAPPAIDPETAEGVALGISWLDCGKRDRYANIGARYFAVKDAFELLAEDRWEATEGASETILGDAQRGWLLDGVAGSDATFKVLGTSICLLRRVVDLRPLETLPAAFRKEFLLSVEDWDGLPNRRDALLTELSAQGDVVAIAGDIHAFFASTPHVRGDLDTRIVEFVTGAVSSGTYKTLLLRNTQQDPTLLAAGAPALALLAEDFLLDRDSNPNPHLAFADTDSHGFLLCEVHGGGFRATAHRVAGSVAEAPFDGDGEALAAAFTETRFRVLPGDPSVWLDVEGVWNRWNPTTVSWEPEGT